MAAKPETRYAKRISDKIPKSIYRMKNNNPYTGGIPDQWFSGIKGDLWVEYKYLPTMPVRKVVDPTKLLSALQLAWLNDRHAEGRNLAVIIGCPMGGVILLDGAWNSSYSADEFSALVKSNADVSDWIISNVG